MTLKDGGREGKKYQRVSPETPLEVPNKAFNLKWEKRTLNSSGRTWRGAKEHPATATFRTGGDRHVSWSGRVPFVTRVLEEVPEEGR